MAKPIKYCKAKKIKINKFSFRKDFSQLHLPSLLLHFIEGFPGSSALPVKNPPAMQETPVHFMGQEDPLGKG